MGRVEEAIEHLFAAAERGWSYTHHTRTCREFESLRRMPGWESLLERIEANRRDRDGG
jgi:hypothetical protein